MSNLNLSYYKTVWNDNFTKDAGFNRNIWTGTWGNSNDFVFNSNGLTITSYQSEGWSNAGFIQPDASASNSQGYGLYSATAYVPANQGVGICIVMWPSDNIWPGAEIDLLENWSDPNSQTGNMTIHWKGAGNSNGQDSHQFSLDLTKSHTYAVDWEQGALTYYIDNREIFQVLGSEVPNDAAHGGVNEAFGAEVTAAGTGNQPTDRVSLTISDMSYSTFVGATTPSFNLSSPGTVQEASVGAGVNVTETLTATLVSTAYEAVFTAAGVAEGGWTAVPLTGGVGSFSAHFQHSGDYIKVVNSTSSPTVTGVSAAVVITDGAGNGTSISVSDPGTVREASAGAGARVTETVSAPGLSTIYEAVFTTANVAEQNWQAVTLNGSGAGSFTMQFEHNGDYIVAINDTTTQSIKGWSTPITITDGSTVPSAVTLTGDNLYANSASGSVVGTLSATDVNSVSYALSYNQRGLFAISGNKLVTTHAMPAKPQSGYYISVVATDSTGGHTTKQFRVGVQPSPAAAAQITAASLTGGSASHAVFLAASQATILAGNGASVDLGHSGGSAISFGSGDADVTGSGPCSYSFMPGNGLETITDFSAAKGDVLKIDHTLRGSMQETVSGGSTLLGFGANHGILLQGVSHFAASGISWI